MLLRYKKKFAPLVANGTKPHTMRQHRRIHPKVGELLHEYEGKGRVCGPLIRKDRQLTGWQEVRMFLPASGKAKVYIDGWLLPEPAFQLLLWNDGFRGPNRYKDFVDFFFAEAKWWNGQIFHTTDLRYIEGMDYHTLMSSKFQLEIQFENQ